MLDGPRLLECSQNVGYAIAIDAVCHKAKTLKFFRHRISPKLISGTSGRLKVIVVDDMDQVRELLMTGKHGCFPDTAFLQFAVQRL